MSQRLFLIRPPKFMPYLCSDTLNQAFLNDIMAFDCSINIKEIVSSYCDKRFRFHAVDYKKLAECPNEVSINCYELEGSKEGTVYKYFKYWRNGIGGLK